MDADADTDTEMTGEQKGSLATDDDDDPYYPPVGSDAIRLFRLGTAPDGAVTVQLERFPLEGTECPPFVSTSYVWGPPLHSGTVLLNGRATPVLPSALSFFRAMLSERRRAKFPPATTWWWMDSLCINQADTAERSAQVRLMSVIYQRAARTAIWLGEADEDSDRAIEFLHTLARQDAAPPPSEDAVELRTDAAGWRATERLLLREWFERVWTLQEFLLGRHATFYCGDRMISRGRMHDAVSRLWDWHQWRPDVIRRGSYEKAWNRFRMLERYKCEYHLPLVGTMAYTATFRVTDPRDRLYSVLGLAGPVDADVVGQPDYRSDTAVVYARFAKSFVETQQSLDIVCLAPLFRADAAGDENKNNRGLGLPSWMPDWSIRRSYSPPVPCMASQSASTHIGNFRPLHTMRVSSWYAAAGDAPPRVVFSDDLRELRCEGVSLGRVDGLGGGSASRQNPKYLVQSTSAANARPEAGCTTDGWPGEATCGALLNIVSRCLVLDRKDRYFRHAAPLEEFALQFRILCVMVMEDPSEVHPTFRDWFQQNRQLLIRGVPLEDAVRQAVQTTAFGDWLRQNKQLLARGIPLQDAVRLVWGTAGHESRPRDEVAAVDEEQQPMVGRTQDVSDWESFLARSRDTTASMGMRLAVLDNGILGMVPRQASKGDVVCVLLGCNIPLVLRAVAGREAFELVGECYVSGYMNGEALRDVEQGRGRVQEFLLV